MKRKAHNSLNEAALQVQSGITPEPEINEVDSMVFEYFNNYFGDNLTEDTSDEDIMEAVYDLIDLTEVVLEAVGLDESMLKPTADQLRTALKKRKENMEDPVMIVKGRDNWDGHVQQKTFTGQDMENAAGYRRKAKIAKNTTPMG